MTARASLDTPPLWAALRDHATQMHFFRFCELLERSAPDRPLLGTTDSPGDDPIRFRSKFRLGFPGREIDAVECDPHGDPDDLSQPPTVRTTFLGLYGVDARMPSYFIDTIAQNHDGAEPLAAFLDLFHHRIVTQYYRIWRKYRYPVGFERDGRDAISTQLLSLAGLGLGASEIGETVGPRKLLSMLGLVNQKTRTAEGLSGVLQHAVPDATLSVEEFHPAWVAIDDTEPMPLGEHCVLGGGFFDCGNCVRVVIAPTSTTSVQDLMPGQTMHADLMHLLRFYLGYEAQAVIEMHVSPDLMPAPVLEPNTVSLGYTTLLARDDTSSHHAPIRVQLGAWNVPSRS
ncbi:type VI secretion system baseplate subunit TssG [Dyella sp.]|uniref:type VI secretion system baseplate subunit TssG n=1 Tax=Dyella sp. TaxID=1869338 RepID=UPI002D79F45D|nr:type VI secretion system baseplate subunit TssG [Dyella sp.]HET7329364.1 type VI secretion system baseplate subunit TssG [Dyella sp.]